MPSKLTFLTTVSFLRTLSLIVAHAVAQLQTAPALEAFGAQVKSSVALGTQDGTGDGGQKAVKWKQGRRSAPFSGNGARSEAGERQGDGRQPVATGITQHEAIPYSSRR